MNNLDASEYLVFTLLQYNYLLYELKEKLLSVFNLVKIIHIKFMMNSICIKFILFRLTYNELYCNISL